MTEPRPPEGSVRAHYTFSDLLGTGGSGHVWRGRRIRDNKTVAIKVAHPEHAAQQALLREYQLLSSPLGESSPQVLDLFAQQRPQPEVVLVMELLESMDWAAWRAKAGYADVLVLGGRLALILSALHARGHIHGDLKPENVIHNHRTALLDFGLATTVDRKPRGASAGFAPPEYRSGRTSPASDVFALGATLNWLAGAARPKRMFESWQLPKNISWLTKPMMVDDPDARPSAQEVYRIICDALPSGTGARLSEFSKRFAPSAVAQMAPEFATKIEKSINALGDDNGGWCAFSGQSGSGKTTTLQWALRTAVARGCWVVRGPLDARSGLLGCVDEKQQLGNANERRAVWQSYLNKLRDLGTRAVIALDDVPAECELVAYLRTIRDFGAPLLVITSHAEDIPEALALGPLTQDATASIIHQSLPQTLDWRELAQPAHAYTAGHPASLHRLLEHGREFGLADALRRGVSITDAKKLPETLEVRAERPGTLSPDDWAQIADMPLFEDIAPEVALDAASTLLEQNRTETSIRMLKALSARSKLSAEARERCGLRLAEAEFARGDNSSASKILARIPQTQKARLLWAKIQLAQGNSDAVRNIDPQHDPDLQAYRARAHLLNAHYPDARSDADHVLSTPQEKVSWEARVMAATTLAWVDLYEGHADRAAESLAPWLEQPVPECQRGQLLATAAVIAQQRKRWKDAERWYQESIAAASSSGDWEHQPTRSINLSSLLYDQGRLRLALGRADEAALVAERLRSQKDRVRALLSRENTRVCLGLANASLSHIQEARELAESTGMLVEKAALDLLYSEALIHLDRPDEARATLEKLRGDSVVDDDNLVRWELGFLEAMAALRAGETRNAQRMFENCRDDAASLGSDRIAVRQSGFEAYAALVHDDHQTYRTSWQALQDVPPTEFGAELGWWVFALRSELARRLGYRQQSQSDARTASEHWAVLQKEIGAVYLRSYGALWHRHQVRSWLMEFPEIETATRAPKDWQRLLAINRELARERDPDRLLDRILDVALTLSGARRGALLLESVDAPEGWMIRASRSQADETWIGFSRNIAKLALAEDEVITTLDALHDDRFAAHASVHDLKIHSVLCVPFRAHQEIRGALYLDRPQTRETFSEADSQLMKALADQASIALANATLMRELETRASALETAHVEIETLNKRLRKELEQTSQELAQVRGSDRSDRLNKFGMVSMSPSMDEVFRTIERVGPRDITVTVTGESGTGKELVARAIHRFSRRAEGPFVSLNCGAIPDGLFESELFGHERGAFTGADRTKPGWFEVAEKGTLFLDEIGDMPLAMQVKLLRVLQQNEYRRVGGAQSRKTDVRVLVATHRDLEDRVREGLFREDLWYRINVVEVRVPALRERPEDIPSLVTHFIEKHAPDQTFSITKEAMRTLCGYRWPGNIRELENEIVRATALCDDTIDVPDISEKLGGQPTSTRIESVTLEGQSLKQQVDSHERRVIEAALASCSGNVSATARALGLTRAGLYKKFNKLGITS